MNSQIESKLIQKWSTAKQTSPSSVSYQAEKKVLSTWREILRVYRQRRRIEPMLDDILVSLHQDWWGPDPDPVESMVTGTPNLGADACARHDVVPATLDVYDWQCNPTPIRTASVGQRPTPVGLTDETPKVSPKTNPDPDSIWTGRPRKRVGIRAGKPAVVGLASQPNAWQQTCPRTEKKYATIHVASP